MLKYSIKLVLAGICAGLVLAIPSAFADSKTKCVATDARGATWIWYADTQDAASSQVLARCNEGSYKPTCKVSCTTPRTIWRCIAHDSTPAGVTPGTWYWTTTNKNTAISNARLACNNHSKHGGCYVAPGSCTAS